MFEVPGWNLPGAIKQQVADPSQTKSSKKRKRQDKPEKKEQAKKQRKTGSNDVPIGERVRRDDTQDVPQGATQNGGALHTALNGATGNDAEKVKAKKKEGRNARRKKAKEERMKSAAGENVDASVLPTPIEALETNKKEPEKKKRKEPGHALVDTKGGMVAEEDTNVMSDVVTVPEKHTKSQAKVSTLAKAGSVGQIANSGATKSTLTPLQAAMAHKLSSARFRHLNEALYTTPSKTSLSLFEKNPEMFDQYHAGFSQQVAVWPENPVDNFIHDILARAKVGFESVPGHKKNRPQSGRKNKEAFNPNMISLDPNAPKALPRSAQSGIATIADLGCGTARLSSSLQPNLKKLKLEIHSYDLHSPSPLVTKADISKLPLQDGELDIAIFCLALMGTNWTDFIDEAWRCLRWKGECWVGEIRSRFGRATSKVVKHSVGAIDKRNVFQQPAKKRRTQQRSKPENDGSDSDEDVEEIRKPMKDVDEYLDTEIDDPAHFSSVKAAAAQETDLEPFLTVMKNHGFALQADADLSNKMFVKMTFVKCLQPVAGKNKREEKEDRRPKVGKNFLKKKAQADEGDLVDPEEEGRVLKPCLYKIR